MSAALTRLKSDKPVRWTTLLGLLLVPLTIAGVFLWGLWNPTDRLENVTAAVVNLDEPVELDGQTVPLGRVLAANLIDGGKGTSGGEKSDDVATNFTWVLTDEEGAADGLKNGDYATVITIPENFSAAATSMSGDASAAKQAHIEITESERGRLIDSALSSIVTQTATSVLNQQLGEQFVGGVFVGMTELSAGIGTAATGAGALADGGKQLTEGGKKLAEGTATLVAGTSELSAGAGELSTGAGALSTGAASLSTGVSELSTGAAQTAAGMRALATGDGTADNQGLAGAAAGVAEYTGMVNGAITGLQQGAGAAIEPLQQFRAAVDANLVPLPEGVTKEQVVAGLDTLIGQLQGATSTAPESQLEQLKAGGTELAAGIAAAATGADQLATGAEQLAGGAAQLATGASELATGASGLATGASGLATGTAELAAGMPALDEGASALAKGLGKSADGAKDLAKGLDEAAAGIPNYTEAERDKLAKTAVTPVKAEGGSDELFNSSGVPLFAGIALWAGALAVFLLLAPLWRRTRDSARGVGWITMRSALPAAAIGAVQGVIAGIVLPIALGYDFSKAMAFFGIAVLAGVAFGLLMQGLSALLGGFGRFIAFALLVVAFAVGIVSTVPGPLAVIGDASPIGSALAGFQAIATGSGSAGGAAVLLALWAGLGLVLTALAVSRERKR